MKKQDNYVSEETAMELLHANIIEKEQPAPTLTECIVWFAERGITIITDHYGLGNEWHTITCFGKDPKKWVSRRGNTSYIEAINAAIRDAAKVYSQINH